MKRSLAIYIADVRNAHSVLEVTRTLRGVESAEYAVLPTGSYDAKGSELGKRTRNIGVWLTEDADVDGTKSRIERMAGVDKVHVHLEERCGAVLHAASYRRSAGVSPHW
jgi:uncharacterized protein (DUF934 family)